MGFQLALVWLWVRINTGAFRSIPVFDPYPFVFLAIVLAFVLLTAFVLIRQNRMSARADRRNLLQLQINLSPEQEVTKVIQMLERMSRQTGIEAEVTRSRNERACRGHRDRGYCGRASRPSEETRPIQSQ